MWERSCSRAQGAIQSHSKTLWSAGVPPYVLAIIQEFVSFESHALYSKDSHFRNYSDEHLTFPLTPTSKISPFPKRGLLPVVVLR
jgi:hypothetical protein